MLEDLERIERRILSFRVRVFGGFVALVFLVLVFRLYNLQVIQGEVFRHLSEENRLSTRRIRAPRGVIYDRHGNVLVANRPSFTVSLILENVRRLEETLTALSVELDLEFEELRARVTGIEPHRRFDPIRIREDVSREVVARLESFKYEWPGVHIEVEPRRSYPYGRLSAHILGYVGEISPRELEQRRELGYRIGDDVGKRGTEKALDHELRGSDGSVRIEVDSLGREVAVLAVQEPTPGHDVVLSLDLGLQQIAEEALLEKTGAIVVLDPRTGDLLAVASSPGIDPNRFSHGLSRQEWKEVEEDDAHPLQNRALQSLYPPGSVFKIVTATAALESGTIDSESTVFCGGAYKFGGRAYKCWKKGGHGEVNLRRALIESCDVYFYQVGMRTRIDTIAHYGRLFGLGRVSGLNFGQEAAGIIPSTEWKRAARHEVWYPGETLSAAIGQGYNLVTPLQMAALAGVVARGGGYLPPRLIKEILDSSGQTVRQIEAAPEQRLDISPASIELVRQALVGVVHHARGTGKAARVEGLKIAGKTGTAQVVRLPLSIGEHKKSVPLKFRDHAWFVCFAPSKNGQVAMAILVEHGGHGGSAAAPLAGKILKHMKNLGFFERLALLESGTVPAEDLLPAAGAPLRKGRPL